MDLLASVASDQRHVVTYVVNIHVPSSEESGHEGVHLHTSECSVSFQSLSHKMWVVTACFVTSSSLSVHVCPWLPPKRRGDLSECTERLLDCRGLWVPVV
jgi:hypothetical protein